MESITNSKKIFVPIFLALYVAFCPSTANCAEYLFMGTVSYSQSPLHNAKVQLENPVTSEVITTVYTDSGGEFCFFFIEEGQYDIVVWSPLEYHLDHGIYSIRESITLTTDTDLELYFPKPVTLVKPYDDSNTCDTSPVLLWNPNDEAVEYTVQLYATSTQEMIANQPGYGKTFYIVQQVLSVGETYAWQITAFDSSGIRVGMTIDEFEFSVAQCSSGVIGDVDNDGKITLIEAIKALQIVSGADEP